MSKRFQKQEIQVAKDSKQTTQNQQNQDLLTLQQNGNPKKRRWIEEFTQQQQQSKKRRVFIDLTELQHYGGLVLCSNHVVNFKIVSSELDMILDKEPFFNPKFTHQIFHKDETVRGYKDLNIDIYLSCSTLRPFINYSYSKISQNNDDIVGTIQAHFGEESLITNREEFIQFIDEESKDFKPLGKKVDSFTREVYVNELQGLSQDKQTRKNKSNQMKTQTFDVIKVIKIYKVDVKDEQFSQINRRLQAMFIFYIDGASFIAVDDYWCYFLVYCDKKLVAYSTAYEHKRPSNLGKSRTLNVNKNSKLNYKLRISQFIVLPPYQRLGIGSTLLQKMYEYYLKDKRCIEISVEDPSEDFQQMKDALDIKLLWQRGYFKGYRKILKGKTGLKNSTINRFNFDDLYLDSQELVEIQQVMKLKKQNILRCFELLILAKLDQKDPLVHQKFAQEIKKKFYYQMNKNLLQPYFQVETIYGSIMPQQQVPYTNDCIIQGIPTKGRECCQGDGKVLELETTSQNRLVHNNQQAFQIQKPIYQKFTPTALPTSNFFFTQGQTQGSYLQFFGATQRFELPSNLQRKIIQIISQ